MIWFREAFTENVGLKALSLAFALGLFVYLHGQQEQQLRTVPVAVIVRPPEDPKRELMTSIPPSIHVTLRGPMRAIDRLIQNGMPPVEIDLRDGQAEEIAFEREHVLAAAGRGGDDHRSPRASISTGRTWSRGRSRCRPRSPASRRRATWSRASPRSNRRKSRRAARPVWSKCCSSPGSRRSTSTGLTEGVYRRRIAIDAPPARVSYIGPQNATVTVTIARRLSEARFAKRPVEVIGVANGVITPRAVDVTVLGPPEVVRALRPEQVVPRADVSNVPGVDLKNHGSASVKVTVDLARAEAEIQPPTVNVRW